MSLKCIHVRYFFYLYKFENKNVFGKKKVKNMHECINAHFTYAIEIHMSDEVNNGIFFMSFILYKFAIRK